MRKSSGSLVDPCRTKEPCLCFSQQGKAFPVVMALCCVAIAGLVGLLYVMRTPEPIVVADPVPVSDMPPRQEWRLGFAGGNGMFFIELLSTSAEICLERDTLVAEVASPADFEGVVLLPFSRATQLQTQRLLNPKTWTVIDLRHKAQQVAFPQLSAVVSATNSGCYYLASRAVLAKHQPIFTVDLIADATLIFALAGRQVRPPRLRLPLVGFPTDEDWHVVKTEPKFRPPGAQETLQLPEIRQALGDHFERLSKKQVVIYGNAIEAVLHQTPDTLWLLNYEWPWPVETEGSRFWGLFRIRDGKLQPLFVSKFAVLDEANYYAYYIARLVAALDLDSDGIDELVIGAAYYEGGNYKVLSFRDGTFIEVYNSFYYGL